MGGADEGWDEETRADVNVNKVMFLSGGSRSTAAELLSGRSYNKRKSIRSTPGWRRLRLDKTFRGHEEDVQDSDCSTFFLMKPFLVLLLRDAAKS